MALTAEHNGSIFGVEPVSFHTPTTTGLGSIEVSDETVGDFYSVSGMRMAEGISLAEARTTLPAGLYVLRAEGKSCKIVIR